MTSKPASDFSDIQYLFLDRDGVLNRKPALGQYVTRWEEFEMLPGVANAIAQLNRAGRKVIVVTNQRGIALGLYSQDELGEIHQRLRDLLAKQEGHLEGIYVCPHDAGQCNCRKPLTGLFEQAFQHFPDARPDNGLMVGDSLRDIEAGLRLGMRTVFIAGDTRILSHDENRAMALAQVSVTSLAELVNEYFGRRE